ncbi:hypothetical protein [Segatella copri]|jgi:hypothetical protein|uniref:hypothetical protein n=1 Tax=Segatella copri TaxID=165179 RepID=UPI002231D0D9|nr:hypothetical protein [Segatella copri]MCW4111485.1 hypothetical protein [Segatella copri]
MKKYIFSVLMAAMAAFTFISCEDVPEPYTLPTKPEAPSAGEPKGTGTAADPFNIAGIIKYIENGGSADQEVYTKGKVVSVKAGSFDASFGSLKYYISDDGTTANQFYVYNGYAGPNRTKFSGEDALKPGDEVVICGKAKNYNGTNEYDTGNYLVSLNGKPTSGSTTPDTPTDGYINETFSKSFGSFTAKTIKGTAWVIDSYGYAKATGYDFNSKTTTPSESYIVSKAIDLSASKSATLEFSYILRYVTKNGAAVEGVKNQVLITDNYTGDPATTKWTDITGTMKEGTDWATWETYKHDLSDFKGKKNVVIALHYACAASSGTWEVKNLSVKEATGGTPDTPSKPDTPATKDGITIDGTTVTLSNAAATTTGASVELDLNAAGLVNEAAVETVKFSDGSTVNFYANGQENGPKFYTKTKGVRVYANNKLIFKGIKKIKQIVMTCDSYNGTNYVGNATATIEFSGTTATYTNLFTETTGGGVQLRVKTIKIVYAE